MSVLVASSAYGEPTTAEVSAPLSKLHFVVRVDDASYLVLATLDKEEHLPPHGLLRLVGEESAWSVIAEVSAADLPADLRAWPKRKVVVGERCRANVVGFAIVSRLVGSTDYAGLKSSEWTADSVLSAGHKVLAARLDRCEGSFARAADAAPILVPRPVVSEEAVASARADFLASEAIVEAIVQARNDGVEISKASLFDDAIEGPSVRQVVAVRHPTTGETWVSIHLRIQEGCGDALVHLWGLYRVTKNGVERKRLLHFDSVDTIEALLDVDGDGQFELLTTSNFELNRELRSNEGEVLERITKPLYECPC